MHSTFIHAIELALPILEMTLGAVKKNHLRHCMGGWSTRYLESYSLGRIVPATLI